MKKNIIFYKGKTQFENTGDLLINRTLLDLISKYAEIVIDDGSMPEEYSKNLLAKIKNIRRISDVSSNIDYDIFFYISLFRNFFTQSSKIYFLDNPGHVFSKKQVPDQSDRLGLLKKRLLSLLGCKFLRIGVTIGPYSDEMFAYQAGVSKFYHRILARDYKSIEDLKKFNFQNFHYIPDLAWAYNSNELSDELHNEFGSSSKKIIVLSFRDCIEGSSRNPVYFSSLLESLEKVFSLFKDFKFILTYQVQYDRTVSEEIFEQFETSYDVDFHNHLLTIEEALHIYSSAEFVISNRMHVLMLAIKSNTLPIALTNTSEHFKLVSIFRDENMEDCLFDIENFNTDRLQEIIEDKSNLKEQFKIIVQRNASIVREKIADLF